MAVEVKVPGVGESVQEGMIESWHKADGDFVERDEVLLELETDKATVEVVAEVSGTLTIKVQAGEVVRVGDVIGTLEEGAGQPSQSNAQQESAPQKQEVVQATNLDNGPAVTRMAQEQNLDVSKIPGSGPGGRVTKEDVIQNQQQPPKAQPAQAAPAAAAPKQKVEAGAERGTERKPMTMLRRRIAERLLTAQADAAILTTFNEVDMTNLLAMRNKYKDAFAEKHGTKLGFMGFFLKAADAALQEYPRVNSYIDGTDILYHNYTDIGVAVSTEKGLMVPIVRNVNKLSILEIEQEIVGYAKKARENKISMSDLEGGTFTVSNGGVFGSLLSTPILNPPQSAILGMHKTQMRPMVVEGGAIEARPVMYLALSYDHRIVDGKEAVGFLVKIKDIIEDPQRLLLGV